MRRRKNKNGKRNEIYLSHFAIEDLLVIWEYSEDQFGDEIASSYQRSLNQGIERLTYDAYIGKRCEKLKTRYRCLKVEHHLIYYKVEGNDIFIYRVLHEKQDHEAFL